MTSLRPRSLAAAMISLLALASAAPAIGQEVEPPPRQDKDDAVVVAVVDGSFNPYHWNFSSAKLPQHQDEDPNNDLPLTQAPHTWLPGFPDPSGFSSYNELPLTLDDANPSRALSGLRSADASKWNAVQTSTGTAAHYYWLPGTKVIGALDFAGNNIYPSASNALHGNGTSSVAVGNIHGTCPECLVVFITYNGAACQAGQPCPQREWANNWAMSQPWIDLISNSFGFSAVQRDRIYDGGNIAQSAAASERGQTILFSAGNGQNNDWVVPNTTYFSSQEGPDWMITVGAIHPNGTSYSGHGKAADVASLGGSYPSGYGGTTVTGTGNFSGTSNSTPVMAGLYAQALLDARRALPGPSRAQSNDVIAVQDPDPARGEAPFACGGVRPPCELGDGTLTATELRTRLLHGAIHTPEGHNVGGQTAASIPKIGEEEFLSEGHGSYRGRMDGTEAWQQEADRILQPMLGNAATLSRPAGEREWFIVDSYCRQGIWDTWVGGYFRAGVDTLPAPNPAFPLRTAMAAACERATPADHRPNLVPLPPFDLQLAKSDDGQKTAIRLSVSTANRAAYALELTGIPDSAEGPEGGSVAYQCTGWTTHRVCQNRRTVGRFVYHAEHSHYHFEDYAKYEVRRLLPGGGPDMTPSGVVAPGGKASFCLIDYDPDGPPQHPVYTVEHPLYLTCAAGETGGVGFQGISPGWKDTYVSGLDGQFIDVEGVPDGRYAVVVTADPDDRLHETNERDNVSYTAVELKDGTLRVL